MNFYLSSFRIGDRPDALRRLAADRALGFVPNALDHVDPSKRLESNASAMDEVRAAGLSIESLDLAEYFGATDQLSERLRELGGVWIRGGNTFVLRQAMRLSGFDRLITEEDRPGFLYAGYSAALCVLGPTLQGLQQVDDPTATPYPGSEVIWEGLGLLDYLILPHYKSDHWESAAIDLEVEYCNEHGIRFRTLRDGEVIVIENGREVQVGQEEEVMSRDPIVEEARRERARIAASVDHDMSRLFQLMREEAEKSDQEIASLPPRKPEAGGEEV